MILIKVVSSKEVKKDGNTYYPAQVIVQQDSEVLGVGTYFLDCVYAEGIYEPEYSYYKGRFTPRKLRLVPDDQLPF